MKQRPTPLEIIKNMRDKNFREEIILEEVEKELKRLDETPDPQQSTSPEAEDFQNKVFDWCVQCFGEEITHDVTERNHRFLEEALELVQTTGATKSECHQRSDYLRSVGRYTTKDY